MKNIILTDNQFGFRRRRSTAMALAYLNEQITTTLCPWSTIEYSKPASWTSNRSLLVASRDKAFPRRPTYQARPFPELRTWKTKVFSVTGILRPPLHIRLLLLQAGDIKLIRNPPFPVVHYGFIMTTNLTLTQIVNLDNGVIYKCKNCLDIFPFHNSNNEFDNPCSNINTNIEVNMWHCEVPNYMLIVIMKIIFVLII